MGFFSGIERKDMGANPALEALIGRLGNFSPGGGMGARLDKRLLNSISSGQDVSSIGNFNPIRQLHAAQAQSIGDEYTSGDNALIASTGGEQANLLQRQKEIALERNRQSEGMETAQASSDLYNSTNDRFQSNRLARKGMQLNAMQGATGAQGNYYANRYKLVNSPGWGQQLTGMFADLTGGARNLAAGFGGSGGGGGG